MNKILPTNALFFALTIGLCSCMPQPVSVEPTRTVSLASPVADSPASGICAEHEGEIVVVTIYPDIPNPRCSVVRPDQKLRIVNARGEVLRVTLAGLQAEIPPEHEYTFAEPFGDLLMPGVHRFSVEPCCGAQLVLRSSP